MALAGGTIVNSINTLPYNCPVPGGMQDGKMVIFQGTCHDHQNSFSLNLALTPQLEPEGNVALHFNPRFTENCIIRTHMQGSWGTEEKAGGMPLKKGTPFEIIIMADTEQYKISINGRHFCNFRHRISMEDVHYLIIVGEVAISSIKFEGGMPVPYTVPYTVEMPGGLHPGMMIYISGVPHSNASRFNVNLMCGPSDHGDIAFHFDARFNFAGFQGQTVRSHKTAGVWGLEDKSQSSFPFVPNSSFDMILRIEAASIKVAINNKDFCEFNHRIQPIDRADHLMIKGDITLTSVRVQ